MDGFGLAAAGRSLLRDYDDVDRMLPDRDRLAAVQDRACRSNALRLIRCIGVPNGIAVKLQLFHSLSGSPGMSRVSRQSSVRDWFTTER